MQLQRRQKKLELVKSIVNSDTDAMQTTDSSAPTPSGANTRARTRLGSSNVGNVPWRPGGVNPARSEPDLAARSKAPMVPRTPSGSKQMDRSRAPFGTGYTPSAGVRTMRRGRSPPPTKPVRVSHSFINVSCSLLLHMYVNIVIVSCLETSRVEVPPTLALSRRHLARS